MYRNILVPVDGSPFSKEALLQGVRIAELSGAKLRTVRVRTTPAMVSSPDGLASGVEGFKTRARELADLYQIANECRGSSTAEVTASLLDGPVSDALEGYIARHKIDLVVMRSNTRQGLARAWFGSVADSLIRNTGVPVFIVGQPSLASALQSGFRFRRILVPLDGSLLAEQSLDAAVALASLDGATVTLLRVVPRANDQTSELRSPLGPASHAAVTEAQNYLDSLVSLLDEPNGRIHSKVLVADDVSRAILQTAQSLEIDVIAIATHGRGAIARAAVGSVAHRLMCESAISTVVVRPRTHVADAELVPIWAAEPSFAI